MTNVLLDAIPYAPFFHTSDEETNLKLSDLCSSLYSEATTIQSCIALFDHTIAVSENIRKAQIDANGPTPQDVEREGRITRSWPFISAREALSALYNFNWALKELNSVIAESSVKATLPKPNGVAEAYANFERRFNKALLARHAASHRTEISNSYEKNAHRAALSTGPVIKPKGADMIISGGLVGRTYTETRKGEILKFDVTWETFAAVRQTYLSVIASIAEADS